MPPARGRHQMPRPSCRCSFLGSFAAQVSVDDTDVDTVGAQPAGELLGDGDTAVLAAGATNGQRRVVLALAGVALLVTVHEIGVRINELAGAVLREHIVTNALVQTGE